MKYARFCDLSFPVSRIGLGCSAAWAKPWFSSEIAKSLVQKAFDSGINHFDTGPNYSAGEAESRLGAALRGIDSSRLLISTKVGTHLNNSGKIYKDFSRAAIQRSVETSRSRLGLDVIPLLYLHFPEISDLTEALCDTLLELKARNRILMFGLNSFDESVLREAGKMSIFRVLMPDYNLLRTSRERALSNLTRDGQIIVAASPLANLAHDPKFLVPKSRVDLWYSLRAVKFYREYLTARRFKLVRDVPGWTPAQIAMGYVLGNNDVTSAVFGTTRAHHLDEIVATVDRDLPEEVRKEIRLTLAGFIA